MNIIPPAYAVDIKSIFGPTSGDTGAFTTLGGLVNVLLPNILIIAGIICFLAVIVTGLKVIQSSGDAKAQEGSKGALTAAIVGLIIIFGAYFFVQIFETIVGIPLLH